MKDLFKIQISENETISGHLTVDQFRNGIGAPRNMFLEEAVEKFNAWKQSKGEAARAKIVQA